MSAASVTAYFSPTIERKRSIVSGESGGGWTMFMAVSCVLFIPPDRGAPQPVVDGLAQPVLRHRHHGDGAGAARIEGAKIAEKIGGGFTHITARRQVHHGGRGIASRYGGRAKGEQ